jgi:putrescine aminotransferase
MNPTVDTRLIQQLDSAHFLHPFTDFKDLATRGSRVITRAEASTSGTPKARRCSTR